MILLYAVLIGLLTGLIRAWYAKRPLQIPELRQLWLVPVAFLPQYFSFFLPATRERFPDWLVSISLLISQALLLWFVIINRKQTGFWMLGLGLSLNIIVIAVNRGFMPISPEIVQRLVPEAPAGSWEIGSRLGAGKDIVLNINETKFWWLADRFLLPDGIPYRVAFSLGDVFLAIGTIWFFGGMGSPGKSNLERMDKQNVSNIFAR